MARILKVTDSILNYFDKNRLYFTTYGEILYLPDTHGRSVVTPNMQAEEDAAALEESKGESTKKTNVIDLSQLALQLQDLGIVETPEEKKKEAPKDKNRIVSFNPRSGVLKYKDRRGQLRSKNYPGLTRVTKNKSLLAITLGYKIPAKSRIYDSVTGALSTDTWDPAKLEAKYLVDPENKGNEARARKRKIRKKGVIQVDSEGIPLLLYAENEEFKKYVLGEIALLHSKLKRGTLPVVTSGAGGAGYPTQLGTYLGSLLAAAFYSADYADFFSAYKDERTKLSSRVDTNKAPKVPHLADDVNFLPHQVYAASFLAPRKSAIVDADPGAGKTLMMLADILHLLDVGKVKRPCIVMPGHLLSVQKEALQNWTNNTVNVIVLSTQTVSRMDPSSGNASSGGMKSLPRSGNHERGLAEAIKLVQGAPPNTIVLTSYSWLRGYPKGEVVPPYPRPDILVDQMGVDMVSLDESHYVRYNSQGELAGRAQAVMQMAPKLEYKRCFSGSIAPNTVEDIFMQASFLDTSVFGDISSFRGKYGASLNDYSGKVEAWKQGALKNIKTLLASTVGMTVRRSAWIHKLPNLVTNQHFVALDDAQRKVYENLLFSVEEDQLFFLDGDDESQPSVPSAPAEGTPTPKVRRPPSSVLTGLQQIVRKVEMLLDSNDHEKWEASPYVKLVKGLDLSSVFVVQDSSADAPVDPRLVGIYAKLTSSPEHNGVMQQTSSLVKEAWEDAMEDSSFDFVPAPALLAKYSAFERLLGAPAADPMGSQVLRGPSRISPKVSVIDKILDGHFLQNNPDTQEPEEQSAVDVGKVLIYTNTKVVADTIQKQIARSSEAIFYDAAHKEALARFKHDDSVKILVAVVHTLTEGHNLQMASRIIHVDLPWMPGAYDQSVARAYRLPPRGKTSSFSTVWVDILLTNNTFEVTKYARLVSKMHQTRQFVSRYESTDEVMLASMGEGSMASLSTKEDVSSYLKVFDDIRKVDVRSGKMEAHRFGPSRALSSGKSIAGSRHIAVPFTKEELRSSPRAEDYSSYTSGIISPELVFLNMGWWLSLDSSVDASALIPSFREVKRQSFLHPMGREFNTVKEFNEILSDLGESGISVPNSDLLQQQVNKKAPLQLGYSASLLKLSSFSKVGEVNRRLRELRLNTRILRELVSKMMEKVFPPDTHVKSSAKLLDLPERNGLVLLSAYLMSMGVIPKTVAKNEEDRKDDRGVVLGIVTNLVKKTSVTEALTALTSEESQASPAPGEVPSEAVEEESTVVPGITPEPEPESVADLIDSDFQILSVEHKTSSGSEPRIAYLHYSGSNSDKLDSVGFSPIEELEEKSLFFLGETNAAVKKGLFGFSRRIYPSGFVVKDLEGYIDLLKSVKFTDNEIDTIFGSKDTGVGVLTDEADEEEETPAVEQEKASPRTLGDVQRERQELEDQRAGKDENVENVEVSPDPEVSSLMDEINLNRSASSSLSDKYAELTTFIFEE